MDVLTRRYPLFEKLGLLLATTTILIAVVFNEWGFSRISVAAIDIQNAIRNRVTLYDARHELMLAETAWLSYRASGDTRYLDTYREAAQASREHLVGLEPSFSNRPERAAELAEFVHAASQRLLTMETQLALASKADGATAARPPDTSTTAAAGTAADPAYWEEWDAQRRRLSIATQLLAEGTQMRNDAWNRIRQNAIASRIAIGISVLLSLAAFLLYLWQVSRLRAAEERHRLSLAANTRQLEEAVSERTRAMSELAAYLQVMQEKQREHLARELHDELGSLLAAVKLDLTRVKAKTPADSAAMERIEQASATLNQIVEIKRRIIEDLHPSSLSRLGLKSALKILTDDFRTRSGIRVAAELEDAHCNEETGLAIFRLVQEALTNIAKYARATSVKVELLQRGREIVVQVADNGIGFDVNSGIGKSHGLAGMRHRVVCLNGTLAIDSRQDAGTRIVATFPATESGDAVAL